MIYLPSRLSKFICLYVTKIPALKETRRLFGQTQWQVGTIPQLMNRVLCGHASRGPSILPMSLVQCKTMSPGKLIISLFIANTARYLNSPACDELQRHGGVFMFSEACTSVPERFRPLEIVNSCFNGFPFHFFYYTSAFTENDLVSFTKKPTI